MATILIVDDRPTNREYLVTLLGDAGYCLLEAANGEAGLEVARAEHPKLIITDIQMPAMDGYEFVRQLRSDPAISATTVIFRTASYLEAEARQLALACGVLHVLAGHPEPQTILKTVATALSSSPVQTGPLASEIFHQDHLRLLTNKLAQKVAELEMRTAELASANVRLQSLSLTDELTGLYNRRGFLSLAMEQLLLARRSQRSIGLAYVDVDNLKTVNDTLGHAAGDAVLKATAHILRQTFRISDVMARIGGDEFAVLLVESGNQGQLGIRVRLQANLSRHNAQGNAGFSLSLSMGIVTVMANNVLTVEHLLEQADGVMYAHKQRNKGHESTSDR